MELILGGIRKDHRVRFSVRAMLTVVLVVGLFLGLCSQIGGVTVQASGYEACYIVSSREIKQAFYQGMDDTGFQEIPQECGYENGQFFCPIRVSTWRRRGLLYSKKVKSVKWKRIRITVVFKDGTTTSQIFSTDKREVVISVDR